MKKFWHRFRSLRDWRQNILRELRKEYLNEYERGFPALLGVLESLFFVLCLLRGKEKQKDVPVLMNLRFIALGHSLEHNFAVLGRSDF